MIRRLIRWALYLFIVVVVLCVAAILLLNTAVKQLLESRLRTVTGMETQIGSVDVGLLTPTFTIENLKLYNTADFGGSIFIDMPELHVEYDPYAFRSRQLHFKLVRLDLQEVAIIQDKKGRFNVQDMEKKNGQQLANAKSQSVDGMKFTGIDTFNLSLGKFRMSNLATGREEELQFGVKNQISHNVKSEADLVGFNLLSLASSSTNSSIDVSTLLRLLTPH
jgi:uncharacterized protein involved in outer membrane biogenesis